MARFKHPKTVSLLSTSISGVQSVNVTGGATETEYEGDDDAGVQDIGITDKFLTIVVEVKDSDKNRDIKNPDFTDKAGSPVVTRLLDVMSIDIALEAQVDQDGSDDAIWFEYIGVHSVKGDVSVQIRDVNQVLDDSDVFFVGVRGKLDFDLQTPLSTAGLPDSSSLTNVLIDNLVLTGVEEATPHAALADGRLRFAGHGAAGAAPVIVSTAIVKTVGDTGTFSFVIESATGGADATVSIVNCVLTRVTSRAVHGDIFQVTYELQAYSSDGVTSPMTVS